MQISKRFWMLWSVFEARCVLKDVSQPRNEDCKDEVRKDGEDCKNVSQPKYEDCKG